MTLEHLAQLLRAGESLTVEFKRAREALNRDVYETICAFLNQRGGTLVLGAADDGSITGVAPEAVAQLRKDLVNTLHNTQKINPPMQLAPEQVELEGQTLLVLSVPESSQVHSCTNRIFSRNEDGDFDITGHSQLLSELYLRKQVSYSENRIFPFIRLEDLRSDLIERVRHNVRLQRSGVAITSTQAGLAPAAMPNPASVTLGSSRLARCLGEPSQKSTRRSGDPAKPRPVFSVARRGA